jgi:hypothetical protein
MIVVLRTLEELISFFFYTFYLWTAAFVSPLVLNFYDFFFLFSLFLAICFFFCIVPVYLGAH